MKIRGLEVLRAGWGTVLLAAPAEVLDHIHGVEVDRKALVVTRILGARHLVQASFSGINPGPDVLAAGVWVDSVHAMTAFALAATDRRRARGGLTDGAVAALWAGLAVRHLRTGNVRTGAVRGRLARAVMNVAPGGRRVLALAA